MSSYWPSMMLLSLPLAPNECLPASISLLVLPNPSLLYTRTGPSLFGGGRGSKLNIIKGLEGYLPNINSMLSGRYRITTRLFLLFTNKFTDMKYFYNKKNYKCTSSKNHPGNC